MKKVLFFYSYQNYDTGSPKAMVSMIDSLDRSRFQPLFLATDDGALLSELERRDVEIIRGDASICSMGHWFRALKNVIRQAILLKKHKVDLIHVNEFPWNLDLVFAALIHRIPVFLHIHNPTRIEFRNLCRIASHKVLICSNSSKETVDNFHYIRDKCEVLYNCVDLNWVSAGTSIRRSLGLAEDDIVVGVVGQISHRKGTDIAIETAKLCLRENDRLKFVFIGPTGVSEETFATYVKELAAELVEQGKVLFLGSRDDIPDLLASMDLFFLPTRAEPFGIVIIEAMAAGLPVVASRTGGIPEIIFSPSVGRTVHPLDPENFARAICDITGEADLGRTIGRTGQASLNGRFDKGSIGGRLQQFYREACNS